MCFFGGFKWIANSIGDFERYKFHQGIMKGFALLSWIIVIKHWLSDILVSLPTLTFATLFCLFPCHEYDLCCGQGRK